MGMPAARAGDKVTAVDIHIVLVPPAQTPTPVPLPFTGTITGGTSTDVLIGGQPAAVLGSSATNTPPHVPVGGTFQRPPTNQGTIMNGSPTVYINGKPAARVGDQVQTCNDPMDLPVGQVAAGLATVLIG